MLPRNSVATFEGAQLGLLVEQFKSRTREVIVSVEEVADISVREKPKQQLVTKDSPVVAPLLLVVQFVFQPEGARLVERVIVQPTHLAIVYINLLKQLLLGALDCLCIGFFGFLKLKNSSQVLKSGTKSKPIRLVDGDHEIDCKMDGVAIALKACFVKKVL